MALDDWARCPLSLALWWALVGFPLTLACRCAAVLQVSDAVVDACFAQDANSHVACETCTGTNFVMVFGEITTNAEVDYEAVVRGAIEQIGFDHPDKGLDFKTCEVLNKLHGQSQEIADAVRLSKAAVLLESLLLCAFSVALSLRVLHRSTLSSSRRRRSAPVTRVTCSATRRTRPLSSCR